MAAPGILGNGSGVAKQMDVQMPEALEQPLASSNHALVPLATLADPCGLLAAWVDGIASEVVPVGDRALHYGDAVFTTIRVHAQQPCWIEDHLHRLLLACSGLRVPQPDWALLRAEIERAAACERAAIVKVLLSRGDGTRGYAPHGASGRRLVMSYAASVVETDTYVNGVQIRFADLVLSEQPLLAGLKHANRLEQVMARAEWNDSSIAEALLCDAAGRVISATAANVFARFGTELRTPALDRAGVAGVCRQRVLQSPPAGFSVTVADMPRAQFFAADELFLSNAVRGIVPVRALGNHCYDSHRAARLLMQAMHPALGLPTPE
ncbi:MAG: aminodeoxychorismate lyase [Pseudomonadota bacterium]|nr:aminodeoxychorismate lyase [Pseudomonadota bacterium]